MRKSTKILGALAVAGLVAVGGSAFTAPGLANTATTNQFFGGTVDQTISGAALSSVDYTFLDSATNTTITSVLLTFADELTDGKTPTIQFGADAPITCAQVTVGTGSNTSLCAVTPNKVGATVLHITVPSV